MSKDSNPVGSEFDPLANTKYMEEEKQKLEQEQKEFLSQTTLEVADDSFVISYSSPSTSTPSINALSENMSDDGQTLYLITEAV